MSAKPTFVWGSARTLRKYIRHPPETKLFTKPSTTSPTAGALMRAREDLVDGCCAVMSGCTRFIRPYYEKSDIRTPSNGEVDARGFNQSRHVGTDQSGCETRSPDSSGLSSNDLLCLPNDRTCYAAHLNDDLKEVHCSSARPAPAGIDATVVRHLRGKPVEIGAN